MSQITFDRAPRFAELSEWLHQLATDHPHLLQLDVLGRSHEDREVWIATVTNTETGSHDEKPRDLARRQHPRNRDHRLGCVAPPRAHPLHRVRRRRAHHACTRHPNVLRRPAGEPRRRGAGTRRSAVLRSLDRARMATRRPSSPASCRPTSTSTGAFLQMRIPDPNGTWKASSAEPRLMVAREPDEDGSGPYFRLFREGRVEQYDGVHVKPAVPVHGIDSNRNFPYDWERHPGRAPTGAGDYPTSESEVRAVVQGIVDRPNVTRVLRLPHVLRRPPASLRQQAAGHLPLGRPVDLPGSGRAIHRADRLPGDLDPRGLPVRPEDEHRRQRQRLGLRPGGRHQLDDRVFGTHSERQVSTTRTRSSGSGSTRSTTSCSSWPGPTNTPSTATSTGTTTTTPSSARSSSAGGTAQPCSAIRRPTSSRPRSLPTPTSRSSRR